MKDPVVGPDGKIKNAKVDDRTDLIVDNFFDFDQIQMLLFSGKPYKGYIILDVVVKVSILMHMLMTTFQIYLLFTIAIGMRFIILNLICILPQQCALYCYYQHTKLKT